MPHLIDWIREEERDRALWVGLSTIIYIPPMK